MIFNILGDITIILYVQLPIEYCDFNRDCRVDDAITKNQIQKKLFAVVYFSHTIFLQVSLKKIEFKREKMKGTVSHLFTQSLLPSM